MQVFKLSHSIISSKTINIKKNSFSLIQNQIKFNVINHRRDFTEIKQAVKNNKNSFTKDNFSIPTYKTFQKEKIEQIPINLNKKNNQVLSKPDEMAMDVVNKDIGLSEFLKNVYAFSAMGIGGSVLTSLLLSATEIATLNPFMLIGTGFVISFSSIFGLEKFKYQLKQKMINKTIIQYSENDPARLISYAGLVTGFGITMVPMVTICNAVSPLILPLSVLLSTFVFGGSSLFAYYKPNKSLLKYQAPLMGALMGFVGIGIVSLFSTLLLGPNIFSNIWFNVDMYGGILLFSGINAMDTHKAIEMYESKNPDHLGCATNLYLNFMNILVRIMAILSKKD